nr:hypothetical protein [Tanacetum cinerariifolium]
MEILPNSSSNNSARHFDKENKQAWHKQRCCSLIPAKSNSLPHAYAQAANTYYKHQDSRIKKAQELMTKSSATLKFKIFLKDIKIIKTKIVKGDCYQAFKMMQSMSMLVKTQDCKVAKISRRKIKDLGLKDKVKRQ